MNLNISSKQFLFLYNSLRRIERDFMDVDEDELFRSTKQLLEDVILDVLDDAETKTRSTGFDKWVRSETSKIRDLEDELNKIKETTANEALVNMFNPVKKDVAPKMRGRKKRTK